MPFASFKILFGQQYNVDELWELMKDKTKIVYDIEDFEWEMGEFVIYDNNGHILQFGQNINLISV